MKSTKRTHRFTLVVRTYESRRHAEIAVLTAFGKRNPDSCEFDLRRPKPAEDVPLAVEKALRAVNEAEGALLLSDEYRERGMKCLGDGKKLLEKVVE